jgi:TetR/AcrR family transcriptional regulator, transcriptional repressor for nem operon
VNARTDMRETLLSLAKPVVQARGYAGLSFRELAKEAGVKNPSIHYHFPTKGDLGAALARRYTEDGVAYLGNLLEQSTDPAWLMDRYAKIFRAALENDNRMCLCGIMSAELDELPAQVRREVDAFGVANVDWIEKVLKLADQAADEMARRDRAIAIYTAIEGAQLVARGLQDIDVFDRALRTYRLTGLIP